MDILDPQRSCVYRLFREHCTQLGSVYVKDLKRLNRDLKDIIILDNSPMSYSLNRDNGFPILSWFEDKTDKELHSIKPILEFLSVVPDVRDYLPKMITNNQISYQRALSIMNSSRSLNEAASLNNNITDKDTNEIRTTSPIGYQIKSNAPQMKNKTNHSIIPTKEKPQINIKIINNNITNLIVNNTKDDANPINSTEPNNNKSRVNQEDNKIPKSINTFRTNAIKTEGNIKANGNNLLNLTEKEKKKPETKHKKVDSFSFGFNKAYFQSNNKTKLEGSNHNRQISLNNGSKLLTDHYQLTGISHNKITDIDNRSKYVRNKKMNLNAKSNIFDYNNFTNNSSRVSTSTRIVTKSQELNSNFFHKTPSNRLFSTSNNPFNKKSILYVSSSYNSTEKIPSTRPGTTRGQQFKIIKQTVKPSCIKDLKIKYNDQSKK